MNLYNIICATAEAIQENQNSDGSFSPGHNGPYKDPETPVRNTAHWCITFLKAYQVSDNQEYLEAALQCGDYLLSDEARPMNSVFYCRKNPDKDFSNGLVGQAWSIEALVMLTEVTGQTRYIDLAQKVYLMHPFEYESKAWKYLNVDGSYNGYDKTFNHQLWFAAVGGLLSGVNSEIKKQVSSFLNYLDNHLELYSDGCIKHKGSFLTLSKEDKLKLFYSKLRMNRRKKSYMKMKSVGYHGFNLYAFAMLKKSFPEHSFFRSNKLKKALDCAASDRFMEVLPESKYGFPYNPPGFEMAYAFETFKTLPEAEIAEWVSWQIKECYDFENNLMVNGGAFDETTAAARLYEATRLNNYELNL